MSSCSVINNSFAQHLEPSDMDDDLLVQSAQAGEEWAFVELCTRNSKRVFNTIYGVTKNREDAEDALQDSMMRAFLHLKQFDGRSSFATWFTRIGINSALMIRRRDMANVANCRPLRRPREVLRWTREVPAPEEGHLPPAKCASTGG
jgi:DNA-directed RNA polymerase specialized sigma24 family protein